MMNKPMDKILKLLNKYSSGKNVIILFAATLIVYLLMLFITIPNVMNYANGMEILDMQPIGYSAEYAKTLLDSLGNDGRHAYLYYQIPLDLVYPILFGLAYSLMLTYFFKKILKAESKLFVLSVIPIIAGVLDYFENIGIVIMLSIYPSFSVLLANITNIFSILKSFSTTLFFLILIISLVVFIIKFFSKQK